MSKKPTAKTSAGDDHGYKHKMVNGELVELTEQEIAELVARDEAAAKEPETKEPTHEHRRSERR